MWRSNQLSYRTGRKLLLGALDRDPASAFLRRFLRFVSVISFAEKLSERNTRTLRGSRNHLSFVSYFPRSFSGQALKGSRKEVFQPHLPVRLPCYDLAPITGITLGRPLRSRTSGAPGFHGLTGGVYKARERIHRAMADARLLANPASWSRVADSSPN